MRVIYHPAAEAELIEAVQFYEDRVPKLGLEFLSAVDQAISKILEAPKRCRVVEADACRAEAFGVGGCDVI